MISQVRERIKGAGAYSNDIFIVLFCLLLGLTVVGAYKAYQQNPTPPGIQYQEHAFNVPENKAQAFMASKTGDTYYSIDCKAGSTIKDSNKIYFKSANDAEKAGFEASKRCK